MEVFGGEVDNAAMLIPVALTGSFSSSSSSCFGGGSVAVVVVVVVVSCRGCGCFGEGD
jgi:hypothetical protein